MGCLNSVAFGVLFCAATVRTDIPGIRQLGMGKSLSREEEIEGLDFTEHGGHAYPDFEVSSHGGVAPSAMGSVGWL